MATLEPVLPFGRITSDELERLAGFGPCDLVEGRVRPLTPTGGEHGRIEGRLFAALDAFVSERDLGHVLVGEVGIITGRNPDSVRGADVLFISHARHARLSRPSGFLDVAPELVVEVLSPWDRQADVAAKVREYLAAGVDVVWVVDPQSATLRVQREGRDVLTLAQGDTLAADGALAGFELPLARLFR